jgi:hypothetical protein
VEDRRGPDAAVRDGRPLAAAGEDGVRPLAHVMRLSGLRRRPVELPLDRPAVADPYTDLLAGRLGMELGAAAEA